MWDVNTTNRFDEWFKTQAEELKRICLQRGLSCLSMGRS